MTSLMSASDRHRARREPARPRRRWTRRLGRWLIALCAAGAMATTVVGDQPPRAVTIGAVTYWDLPASLASVDLHRASLDEVTPWWYGLSADGSVTPALAPETIGDAVARLRASGVRLIPTVANTTAGTWAPDVVRPMIHDPDRRQAHVAELVALASTHDFAGLQIDYEDLAAADRQAFSLFVGELAAALHAERKVLYVTVHAKTTDGGYDQRNLAQDYAALGDSADRLVVMAYDWHWAFSAPGPIAPTWWVDDVLDYATSVVPAEKLALGVGLYGYDWSGGQGRDIRWHEASRLAAAPGATPGRDSDSDAPYLRYRADGVDHEVWYEDAESIGAKLELADAYGVGAVEFWRLGGEDPGVWGSLSDKSGAGR
jgi:spore germination protein YaaH